jgi:sortase A
VEPDVTEDLLIEEGKDYCTLVTCTPYGINSHRMLVRGRRVDNLPEQVVIRVTADALQVDPLIVATVIAVSILLLLVLWVSISSPRKRKK